MLGSFQPCLDPHLVRRFPKKSLELTDEMER
jgi:hypothetical protein